MNFKKQFWILKSKVPVLSPKSQHWTFYHKSNPGNVELVHYDIKGGLRGQEELVQVIRDLGLSQQGPTEKDAQFYKEYAEKIKRSQTGKKIGAKGNQGGFDD